MKNIENFTETQLIRLSAFLREDELHIDDIVETSIDDISSSFKIKQNAMESGRIELKKLCQPQLQFSMNMANIYALPEFEPIIDQFQLGNMIKVALRPDYIKQSRLMQVDINFDDFSDFSCEFGELKSLRSQSDIHADLLKNVISAGKSVATNSSYWTHGTNVAKATDLKIQQGLLDAVTQIKAIDGTQGVVIDKYGILLRKTGDGPDGYDLHQTRLVNNMILMTDDGWKTARTGLGQFAIDGEELYGLIAEAVISGYIEGSKIVGGEIYSSNYNSGDAPAGTYIDLLEGDFSFAGKKLIYDSKKDTLTLSGVTIQWDSTNKPDIQLNDLDAFKEYKEQLETVSIQLDGKAETWYQATDPSTDWNTDEKKEAHVGDLWYYTGNTGNVNGTTRGKGTEWIWQKVGAQYTWCEMDVPDAVYNTIDGKSTIYTTISDSTDIAAGDLLIPTADITYNGKTYKQGKVYRYDGSSWYEINYTDDSALTSFIQGTYAEALTSIQNQLDKKAVTYYQTTPPGPWTDEECNEHVGDLWKDSDDNGKEYVYTKIHNEDGTIAYSWVESAVDIPDEVFSMIGSKSTIYVSAPTSQQKGDLLIPSTTFTRQYSSTTYTFTAQKIYRCTDNSESFVPSYWIEVNYTDDTKADAAYDLADKAQGIANQAKTLGESLVEGLGFQETEIAGNYIISPVIAGGTLLIGDKDGMHAEITSEGKLICTDADVSGHVEAKSGYFGNWNIATDTDDSDEGYLYSDSGNYRVWLHTPTSTDTWAYSVQEKKSNGSYVAKFYVKTNGDIYASGKITTADDISSVNINASKNITANNVSSANITASGNINASGGISGVNITASNNITASENITGANMYSYGNIISYGTSSKIHANGEIVAIGDITTNSDIYANGNLTVIGTKSRLTTTENYGNRLLYCYESPSPMFGDIGEGQIDDLGKCYIFLDDVFAETIDTDCMYQVFLQPYGKGECYVAERTSSYFIVEGTKNLSFGWEIKAIQRNYDTTRLEEFDIESEKIDYVKY